MKNYNVPNMFLCVWEKYGTLWEKSFKGQRALHVVVFILQSTI